MERLVYVNAPGLLGWIVAMKWLPREPSEGVLLRVWDNVVVPMARRVEAVKAPPVRSVAARRKTLVLS